MSCRKPHCFMYERPETEAELGESPNATSNSLIVEFAFAAGGLDVMLIKVRYKISWCKKEMWGGEHVAT